MQDLLKQNKLWENFNKKIYKEIVAISTLEKEDIWEVLNNLLGDGIQCYKKRNKIQNFNLPTKSQGIYKLG